MLYQEMLLYQQAFEPPRPKIEEVVVQEEHQDYRDLEQEVEESLLLLSFSSVNIKWLIR